MICTYVPVAEASILRHHQTSLYPLHSNSPLQVTKVTEVVCALVQMALEIAHSRRVNGNNFSIGKDFYF